MTNSTALSLVVQLVDRLVSATLTVPSILVNFRCFCSLAVSSFSSSIKNFYMVENKDSTSLFSGGAKLNWQTQAHLFSHFHWYWNQTEPHVISLSPRYWFISLLRCTFVPFLIDCRELEERPLWNIFIAPPPPTTTSNMNQSPSLISFFRALFFNPFSRSTRYSFSSKWRVTWTVCLLFLARFSE